MENPDCGIKGHSLIHKILISSSRTNLCGIRKAFWAAFDLIVFQSREVKVLSDVPINGKTSTQKIKIDRRDIELVIKNIVTSDKNITARGTWFVRKGGYVVRAGTLTLRLV